MLPLVDQSSQTLDGPKAADVVPAKDSTRPRGWIALGLVLLCLIAYAPIWGNDFIDYDDGTYLLENQHVRNGLSVENAEWAWTNFDVGLWIPLVWMSFQADASLSHELDEPTGLLPSVYHGQNLFWHTATVLLLFFTLARLTGRTVASAMVAALFAVHPLHVESVAWATERKDVLSAFLWVLTIAAHVRYATVPSVPRYLLVVLVFALGLTAKPMLVTLPCVLLLLDYWPLRRLGWALVGDSISFRASWKWVILEKLPLFLMAIAGGMVAVKAQTRELAVISLEELPISSRLANAMSSYGWYLEKTFWPTNLTPFYPHPMNGWSWGPVLASAAVLLAVSAAALLTTRRAPWFVVGWLWFLGTFLPVIGLMQAGRQARADRFVYIPHIGLFIALVWGSAALLDRWKVGTNARVLLGLAAVSVLTAVTHNQVQYWRDVETTWKHALEATERNDFAHTALGQFYMRRYGRLQNPRDLEKAVAEAHRAYLLNPEVPGNQYRLGSFLLQAGQAEEACDLFRAVLRNYPDNFFALQDLGSAELMRGNYSSARDAFRLARDLQPQFPGTHIGLANAAWAIGDRDEARANWEAALALDRDRPEAYGGLGMYYLWSGANADAERCLNAATRLDPGNPRYWSELGIARGRQGQWDAALLVQDKAARTGSKVRLPAPEQARLHLRLAYAYGALGRSSEARQIYTAASQLDATWPTENLEAAWKLATSPRPSPGDAATACELATGVCQATDSPSAHDLDVLATALASAGRFGEAAATARKAIAAASGTEADDIKKRLTLYEANKPYVRE